MRHKQQQVSLVSVAFGDLRLKMFEWSTQASQMSCNSYNVPLFQSPSYIPVFLGKMADFPLNSYNFTSCPIIWWKRTGFRQFTHVVKADFSCYAFLSHKFYCKLKESFLSVCYSITNGRAHDLQNWGLAWIFDYQLLTRCASIHWFCTWWICLVRQVQQESTTRRGEVLY